MLVSSARCCQSARATSATHTACTSATATVLERERCGSGSALLCGSIEQQTLARARDAGKRGADALTHPPATCDARPSQRPLLGPPGAGMPSAPHDTAPHHH